MKTIIAAMLTCVVIFGLSAGATQFLMQQPDVEVDPLDETALADGDTAEPSETSTEPQGDSVPVAFRPDNNISVEAVLQMSDSIKRMEQELAAREKRVKQDEMRVKLIFDDLATEQDELRAFSEGIDAKLELLERMNAELKTSLAAIETEKAELQKLSKKAESKNATAESTASSQADEVKGWFEDLPPEQAAQYLREFSDNGKLAFAASLLQKMPDRQKSKILGAMADPILVDQLIEALTNQTK